MGIVGLGFGSGRFALAYVLSFPAFLLNFWSAKVAAIGMWVLLLVVYLPVAMLNWPIVNPLRLLASPLDKMLLLMIVLTQISTLALKLNKTASPSIGESSASLASKVR